MRTYLIDYAGKTFELPVLLGWEFSYGDSLPCDSFEISFVFDESMYDMLCGATRFRAENEGETVFFGVVDEFEISLGDKGKTVSVCGRSLAALLLDNEAEAAELNGVGLDFILDKYVYPFGVDKVRKSVLPPRQQLVVASGSSCWRVLEDFLWFGCGETPRFSRDGTLVLGKETGRRFLFNEYVASSRQVFKSKRYGVISSVLVKNKSLGSQAVIQNSEFLSRGGSCRRVVNVPRYTRYDAMRATGDYQIRQSRLGETQFSLTLPTLFAAFPGDVMDVRYSPTGVFGAYVVGRTRCFAFADGAGTEIIMTGREK